MLLLFIFSIFIEDTVYVHAPFPYRDELRFDFPAFSHEFDVYEGLAGVLSENNSILLKEYGNLSSLSIRGTRTQDIDIELNGIPLKTIQNDYADVSILPSALRYKGIIVKHPLSSYGSTISSGGGIFLNVDGVYDAALSLTTDKTMEVFLSQNLFKKQVLFSFSQRKKHSSNDYSKFFCLFSGKNFSALLATRKARVSGPIGTLIVGRKDEVFAGYSAYIIKNEHLSVMMKGNAFALSYQDSAISDLHRSFYNSLLLKTGILGLSFVSEYLSSTKTANRERRTISILLKRDMFFSGFHVALNGSVFYDDRYLRLFTAMFLGASKSIRGVVVYANFSKGIHLPSFFDLYWPEDIFARGNPELLPEYIFQYELGAKYLRNNSAMYLTFFHRKVKNMIQWLPVKGKYSPYNTGEHGIRGIEAKLEYKSGTVIAGFTGSLGFFNEILYYPHVEEGFYINMGKFRISVSYIGAREKRPESIKVLPSMEIIDIGYEKTFFKKVNLTIGARNLLGERMEWIAGYPQEGRIFYTTIGIKWR